MRPHGVSKNGTRSSSADDKMNGGRSEHRDRGDHGCHDECGTGGVVGVMYVVMVVSLEAEKD